MRRSAWSFAFRAPTATVTRLPFSPPEDGGMVPGMNRRPTGSGACWGTAATNRRLANKYVGRSTAQARLGGERSRRVFLVGEIITFDGA